MSAAGETALRFAKGWSRMCGLDPVIVHTIHPDEDGPVSVTIPDLKELGRDARRLDAIAQILRDPDWSSAMLEDIAELVAATGRDLEGDGSPTWDRH